MVKQRYISTGLGHGTRWRIDLKKRKPEKAVLYTHK
jgi:hypothetical protein